MSEARAILDKSMAEEQLQETVEQYLTQFNWRWFHLSDKANRYLGHHDRADLMSKGKGFFDIVAMRGGVCLFIELKTEQGSLDPEQREWMTEVRAVQEHYWDFDEFPPLCYYLWRPRHLSDGTIERTLR